jgi:hypothetical protein
MKGMYAKTLVFASIIILMFSMGATAQEENLPDPGITPDSPLYGLDKALESIQGVLNSGNEQKSRYGLSIAEERLAEAKAMAEKGNYQLSEEMSNEYEKQIENTIETGNSISDSAQRGNIQGAIANTTTKHQLILEKVRNELPKPAQAAINNSLKASSRGRENALRSLGDTNPAKAAKIRFEFANNRINSIKGNVSKEKLVKERVREYANEMNNTQELIKKANTENMNITALEEKVANATSKHLTVLKNVHDKVPESAKSAIKHAMNASVRGQKKALENLQDKNPEKAEMIKKNIPDFVKSKNTTGNTSKKTSPDMGKDISKKQPSGNTGNKSQNNRGDVATNR